MSKSSAYAVEILGYLGRQNFRFEFVLDVLFPFVAVGTGGPSYVCWGGWELCALFGGMGVAVEGHVVFPTTLPVAAFLEVFLSFCLRNALEGGLLAGPPAVFPPLFPLVP